MVVIYFWLISFRLPPGAQYVKCRAPRCTEADRQYLFPGHVDTNSLVVQDEYVFTQVCVVTDYFFLSIKLIVMSSSFHVKAPVSVSFDFSWAFWVFFYFGLPFHQNLRNDFPQHTPVPHQPDVCFDYVLSRSCQGMFSVRTDTRRVWQMWLLAESTLNRQVGVLITIHSDFDSN